jgi:hypothetical protein
MGFKLTTLVVIDTDCTGSCKSNWKKYKGCHLRYQQALLDIYGVFYIATSTGIDYYKGKKAALKMTNLLQNRLRVSDPRIAQLKEGVIQGVGPGVTEIQVMY